MSKNAWTFLFAIIGNNYLLLYSYIFINIINNFIIFFYIYLNLFINKYKKINIKENDGINGEKYEWTLSEKVIFSQTFHLRK